MHLSLPAGQEQFFAEVGVWVATLDEEAEGAVDGFADAYAWGGLDFGGTVAVVGDLDGGGGGEVTSRPLEFLRVMSEGLTETAGASGEKFGFCVVGKVAEIGHGFEAVDWIEGSDEDSACFAGNMRGDVEGSSTCRR